MSDSPAYTKRKSRLKIYKRPESGDESGEQSISSSMSDVESDDDTLENEHDVGLKLDEDEEHPKPLDIAKDIDSAEKNRQTH